MPPVEKLPRRERLFEVNKMENVTRLRPNYRVFAEKAEKPTKAKRQRTEPKLRVEKPLDTVDDGQRYSIPLKSNRFGHIFGNMQVSRKVKNDGPSKTKGVKAPSKTPILPAAHANFPERIQRFLLEPSLVSFSRSDDDMAWLDRKSVSDAGVSERYNSPHPERGRKADVVSLYPSQQSTQMKLRKTPVLPSPQFVSRGCSPIIIYPHDMDFGSKPRKHRSRTRNEAVQTVMLEIAPDPFDVGSLNHSVALDLPLSQAVRYDLQPDNIDNIYREIAGESMPVEQEQQPYGDPSQDEHDLPSGLHGHFPERVILSSGEVAYLYRPNSHVQPDTKPLSQPFEFRPTSRAGPDLKRSSPSSRNLPFEFRTNSHMQQDEERLNNNLAFDTDAWKAQQHQEEFDFPWNRPVETAPVRGPTSCASHRHNSGILPFPDEKPTSRPQDRPDAQSPFGFRVYPRKMF